MTLDPTTVWAVVRDGKIAHIRLTEGVIEACAAIERQLYPKQKIEVVPMILTEVAGDKNA